MYLKALYIQGFKSFANKTKIDFNNRITGVVGPNGSGKSNISDAIMWVLGETSVKTLRGSKMEDVIFSGTDSRKPLGFAEVTIVFDNSDRVLPIEFSEVSVTRRMYRSLESEFSINNTKCRLKDIKELFMDTGIGKDGYSLIGQGKIESILSSKPEQRRAIFEEAAGISKFKLRKKDSERKLEKTRENLIRLNDIISEIEKRKVLLEAQSRDAVKYKKLFGELKNTEISLASTEIAKKRENIKNSTEKITALEEERKVLEENLQNSRKSRSERENQLNSLEEQLNIKQAEEVEQSKILENKNSRTELIELEIRNAEEDIKVKTEQKSEYASENRISEEKIEELEQIIIKEKEELKRNLEKEEKTREDLNSKNRVLKEIEENKNSGNSMYIETNEKILSLKSKIEMTESMLKEKNSRIKSIDANLEVLLKNNREIDLSLTENRKNLGNLEEKNSELLENRQINDNYLKELEKLSEKMTSELYELKNSYEEKNARYNALKNVTENYEGFNKSVKNFMNISHSRNLFRNSLIGPVADKINVKEKYEKAISVALGASVQNIIIEHEKDAPEMISLLTRENLGRVTFLPLDSIKFSAPKVNLSDFGEEVLGFADSLVEYEKRYDSIIKSLLGKIIVTKDFNSGAGISKRLNRLYRVVTLEGDSFNIGGSISGGSIYRGNISILSRTNELKNLKEEVESVRLSYNSRLKDYEKIKSKLEELNFTIVKNNNEIEEISREIFSIKNTVESLNSSRNNNQDYIDKYQSEKSSYRDSIEKDFELISSLKSEKDRFEDEMKLIIEKNDTTSRDSDKIKDSIDAVQKELSEILVVNAKKSSEISAFEKEIQKFREDIERNRGKIQSVTLEIENKKESRENSERELKILKENLTELNTSFEKLLEEIASIRESKKECSEKAAFLRNEESEILDKINSNQRDIDNKNYNIEKNRIELNNIAENIYNDYKVEEKDITEIEEIKSLKEAKEKINRLKNEIDSLNDVNILAIEEYEEIKERLDFNLTQKQDLLDSIDEIKNILSELDREMNILFKKSFKLISEYFDEIFKILFNGGRAEIEIAGEDALNDGIEIKAQPPGKRFQSLSLLSGGERALTAVALLFALLKVRPAPFCILDEIDAALDDANIRRYTDYLLTLEDIQFIIITHRKSTMEIANKLYGVTMEEKGISKLISLELND